MSRIIGFGWYDGLLSGVAQCRKCESDYRFFTLGWDVNTPDRIYCFAAMQRGAFERILNLGGGAPVARWPVWSPHSSGISPSQNAEIDAIMRSAVPEYAVISHDLSRSIVAAAPLTEAAACHAVDRMDDDPEPDLKSLVFWRDFLSGG